MFKSLKITLVEKLTVFGCLTLIAIAAIVSLIPRTSSAKEIRLFETPSSKFNLPMSVSPTTSYLRISAGAREEARQSGGFTLPGVQIFAPDEAGKVSNVTLTLELREFSVIDARTQIVLVTPNGEVPTSMPTVKTYKGRVQGEDQSFAFLAIDAFGVVTGRISYRGEAYNIGYEAKEQGMCAITATTLIPNYASMIGCQTADEVTPELQAMIARVNARLANPKLQQLKPRNTLAAKAILMALDCDKEAVDHFGGEAGLKDYLTARFAAISAIYEEEIGVEVNIGRWEIATSSGTSFNSMNTALDAMGKKWFESKKSVDRSVAHYISRQDMGSPGGSMGLAWLNQLCSKGQPNGGSGQIAGGYAVDRIMGSSSFPTIDENVIAHELGHNVASPHTHSCTYDPPVDSCAGPDGAGGANTGTCFSQRKQVRGSIMSYCSATDFTFKRYGKTPVQDNLKVVELMKEAVDAHDDCLPAGIGGATALKVLPDKAVEIPAPEEGKDSINYTEVSLKNAGTTTITVTGGTVGGTNKSDFHLINSEFIGDDGKATKFVLTAGQEKPVTITFKPLVTGEKRSAYVTFNNTAGIPTRVDIKAGEGAEPTPIPDIEYLQPPFVDFGEVKKCVGCWKDTDVVFMTNNTENPVAFTTPKINPATAPFTIINGTLSPIAAGETRKLRVRFTPTSAQNGYKKAQIILSHALLQPGKFDTIPLYGNQVAELTSVKEETPVGLEMVFPSNPFRSSLSANISVPAQLVGASLHVEAFDNLGRSVGVVFSGNAEKDMTTIDWRPDNLAAGQYKLVARVGDHAIAKSVVYTK